MRWCFGSVVLLLAVAWGASIIETPLIPWPSDTQARGAVRPDGWRRTANGWEAAEYWSVSLAANTQSSSLWAIHPSLVAAGLLLLSLAVLTATAPVKTALHRQTSQSADRLQRRNWPAAMRMRDAARRAPDVESVRAAHMLQTLRRLRSVQRRTSTPSTRRAV